MPQLLHVSLLREYLALEFGVLRNRLPFEYDFERKSSFIAAIAICVGIDFVDAVSLLAASQASWTLCAAVDDPIAWQRLLWTHHGHILRILFDGTPACRRTRIR